MTDKPCKYRLTRTSYIDGTMYVVQDDGPPVFVEYAGNPGTNMEPTDAEGQRRQDAYFASKKIEKAEAEERAKREAIASIGGLPPGAKVVSQAESPQSVVPIPDGWDKGNSGSIILLAAKLGAPDTVTTASAASEFIKGEIARRLGHAVAP